MKDKNLIASVALFSELYNSNTYKSIADILAEFIKGAVIYEQTFNLTSGEAKDLLKRVYGFDIPESVVRTTLNNKLKDVVTKANHYYHFAGLGRDRFGNIQQDFDSINERQNHIVEKLYHFIAQKGHAVITDANRKEILDNFIHFLMDNGHSDEYSNYISAFVLANEQDLDFKTSLNSIREGLILYQGITYTADLNQLGSWRHDLTIYLGTEQLFSALGYNGTLYKEIFDDFYKLVVEINQASQLSGGKTKRKKIELRYFEESKIEIDNFFGIAELIKSGKRLLDPSRSAMVKIIKDSERISDIRQLRVVFDRELTQKGIFVQDFNLDLPRNKHFNVEDPNVIEELRAIARDNRREFDEDQCHEYFQLFTKINALRQGVNNVPFDRIGHIFMTETAFAKYLAHHNAVKFKPTDIPFAKDVDFMTTRFWFSLKKGFGDKASLPKSFDVITKAKVILSSHLASSLSSSYNKLLVQRQKGVLSEEEAIARSYALREKPNLPEEINGDNIDTSLDFLLNDDHLEDFYRENVKKTQLLKETTNERDKLAEELRLIRAAEQENKKKEALQIEREAFVENAWTAQRSNFRKDLEYSISCFIPEITAVLFLALKNVKSIDNYLDTLGSYQYLYWVVVAILVAICVYGRSHLYNKDRIKNGYRFIRFLCNYKQNVSIARDNLAAQFDRDHHP